MDWIDVHDRLPKKDQVVDLWANDERHTNYVYVRNYNDTRGNNFFESVKGGLSCIRIDTPNYTNATHWRALPSVPKKQKKSLLVKKLDLLKASIKSGGPTLHDQVIADLYKLVTEIIEITEDSKI